MINKRLIKYLDLANELTSNGKDLDYVISQLREKGATYAITFRVLEKLGYNIDDVELVIKKSEVWKGVERSFEDLFFDFLELDDNLIDPDSSYDS